MNREELQVRLRDEGVPETWYHLYGAHHPERHVLDHRAAGWVVFYTERGDESAVKWFEGEAEACEELLTRLRSELRARFRRLAHRREYGRVGSIAVAPITSGCESFRLVAW